MAVRCDAYFRNRIEIIHAERTHALSRAAHTQYDTHTQDHHRQRPRIGPLIRNLSLTQTTRPASLVKKGCSSLYTPPHSLCGGRGKPSNRTIIAGLILVIALSLYTPRGDQYAARRLYSSSGEAAIGSSARQTSRMWLMSFSRIQFLSSESWMRRGRMRCTGGTPFASAASATSGATCIIWGEHTIERIRGYG